MIKFTFDLCKLQMFFMILSQQDINYKWPCAVHQTITIPGFPAHQSTKRGFISPKSIIVGIFFSPQQK